MMPEPKRFLLIWFDSPPGSDSQSGFSRNTVRPVRRAIEDQVSSVPEEVEIDLWLDSFGGDAHAAYKLALLLRATANKIRVVVPDVAKSAATLLSLVGNDTYMGSAADFGPLDAQMPDEGSLTGSTSALNIARAADEVARDAVEMAVRGGADMLAITGLSRAQTLDAMLRFSASFSEPLVSQLDPKVVHHAKQMLLVTARYAEQILTAAGNQHPKRIADALVETFPTHGYAISLKEAHVLGLPVHPIQDYEYVDQARAAHRAFESGTDPMIAFCPLDTIVKAPEKKGTSTEPKAASTTTSKAKGGARNGRSTRRSNAEPVRANGLTAGSDSAG